VHGLPEDSPQIRDRNRKIASTLYTVGMETLSDKEVIEMIIRQDGMNRETTADTPEALAFMALLDVIEEKWGPRHALHPTMTRGLFSDLVSDTTTREIADRYNLILVDQGNADREPVKTRVVTTYLTALGLERRFGTGGKSYMNPDDPYFISNFNRSMAKYAPRMQGRYKKLSEEA